MDSTYKNTAQAFSVRKQMRLSTAGASMLYDHAVRSRNEFSRNSLGVWHTDINKLDSMTINSCIFIAHLHQCHYYYTVKGS